MSVTVVTKEVVDAAKGRRVKIISVERRKSGRRRVVYFGTSASPCYVVFTLENLMDMLKFALMMSCVRLHKDTILRHANGTSIAMGRILSSQKAILGGMRMESRYDAWGGKHKLLRQGLVVLKGIRVQDDSKLFLGYNTEKVTRKQVEEVFDKCISVHLYPTPFQITRDDRNRYLEVESVVGEGGLIWYKHHNKNAAAWAEGLSGVKNGQHCTSYSDRRQKAATIVGHLQRVRGCCVFHTDALMCCILKLKELEAKHSGHKSAYLAQLVKRKAEREQDNFWETLVVLYEYCRNWA